MKNFFSTRTGRILGWVSVGCLFFLFLFVIVTTWLVFRVEIPTANSIVIAKATTVYYSDGETILGRLGSVNKIDISIDDVPEYLPNAILAAEDREYYSHTGFSIRGIMRAFVNNVFRGGDLEGGSTITQQYTKNAYLSFDKTITRKYRELVLAIKLETSNSKREILENYMNVIFLGRDSYGVEAASRAYFGKTASELTLSESAVIAALARSPGGYNPESARERLQNRWEYVLDGMVTMGVLSQDIRDLQSFPKIQSKKKNATYGKTRGYLLTSVHEQLLEHGFTENDINLKGLKVTSTFDVDAQKGLVDAVKKTGPKKKTKGVRIGAVFLDVNSGEVRALYGGKNYTKQFFNNATHGTMLAGSTFKPFGLIAAFEHGIGLNSLWNGNSPRSFANPPMFDYELSNYGGTSFGMITLDQAITNSVNTVFVDIARTLGPDVIYEVATRLGIPESRPGMQENLAFVLGTASPTPLDMARAYAVFSSEGKLTSTSYITKVVGANGGLLYAYEPMQKNVLESRIAREVNYALQNVVREGTGAAAQVAGVPVAGKTGTTDNDKSAWFVGYTPGFAGAVAMSKEEKGELVSLAGVGERAFVTGGSFPAQIWSYAAKVISGAYPEMQFSERDVIETENQRYLFYPDDDFDLSELDYYQDNTQEHSNQNDTNAKPRNFYESFEIDPE